VPFVDGGRQVQMAAADSRCAPVRGFGRTDDRRPQRALALGLLFES